MNQCHIGGSGSPVSSGGTGAPISPAKAAAGHGSTRRDISADPGCQSLSDLTSALSLLSGTLWLIRVHSVQLR